MVARPRNQIAKTSQNTSRNSMGVLRLIFAPHRKTIQQNTCTPLGIAIMTLATIKKVIPRCGRLVGAVA